MLKFISSIDVRFQLVEEKFEELGKKLFEFELFVEIKVFNSGFQSSDIDFEIDQLDGLNKNIDEL